MTDTEHLRFEGQDLAGLWDIDTSKATGDRWTKIEEVVKAYARVHPREMEMLVLENKAISDSRKKASGATDDNFMRWGASIPPALMFKLEQVEPMLFADKRLFHQFIRKYKGFRICKTV